MSERTSVDARSEIGADRLHLEAESAVLGAVLLAGSIALPALQEEGLRAEDFSSGAYRRIYGAMEAMHEAGEPVDALTLAEHLQRHRALGEVGGRVEIDSLRCPDVANMRQYARMVVRASMWRHREMCLQMAMDAVLSRHEGLYRAGLAETRRCELRFRPLLERDVPTL